MDSPSSVIALSSSISSRAPRYSSSESLASIITVSSEIQRVPVSWESDKVSRQKEQVLDFDGTPNHSEKVRNWMNSWKYDCNVGGSHENEDENKKSTCIRYDFNKSPPTNFVPQSCYTVATPLFTYMEEAKKHRKIKDAPNADTRPNGSNLLKKNNCDTPLSPETQKKELCSYLQLMKPEDKQHNFFVEYRRSTRVKTQHNETKETKEKSSCHENVTNDVDYPTLKSFGELDIKMNKINVLGLKRKNYVETVNKLLPLPPKKFYAEVTDFEDCVREMLEGELKTEKKHAKNGSFKKVEKRRKFNFNLKFLKKFKRGQSSYKRPNLRSKGRLRNISLDKLMLRKSQLRKKARKKMIREFNEKQQENVKKPEKNASPRCEIISVHTNSDDENVDLKNFVDDMLELDKMSEEHRKSVIESRILASSSITNLINKRSTREPDVQRAYKIFSDLSNEKKTLEEKENDTHEPESCVRTDLKKDEEKETSGAESVNVATDLVISEEHDYANYSSLSPEPEEKEESCQDNEESVETSLSAVPISDLAVLPVNKEVEMKSLHRSLTVNNRRKLFLNNYGLHNWSSGSNSNRKLNHSISISKKNGVVLRAFYQDYNLVVAQQNCISFWTQSALGNVLGAQNMWIPKGEIQRIALNSTYVQKYAMDMVITTETSVAYVELWTKEHKSDVREVPVADVFATVYFWRLRQNGLDKKALQLENIKGFTDDVQYCVLKCYPKIIVSWHSVQGTEKKTKIHSYHLAADFQTVANISEIQPVEHYVSSLHNIEDCDSLVMGCGENKITLWNVEYGYIVATIEMSAIKSPLSTLWVKCDRGFLFTIQECLDQELRLIAINGMNHSWKKLQNYNPLAGFDGLKGVCIENGILVAYYAQGILCWNAQTGELIVEEVANECYYFPSGKHVIMIVNENIIVRHSLSHLITDL